MRVLSTQQAAFQQHQSRQPIDMVSNQQIEDFQTDGFVVIDDVLDPVSDVQPIVEDYSELLDRLAAKWHSEGSISSTHKELNFLQRLTQIMSESSIDVSRYFDISLPDRAVSVEDPIHLSEKVFALISNARLLDVAESFVGPEILSNPVQHVRIKPPENRVSGKYEQNFLVRRTGWHQDQGVIRAEADQTNMLTVWVPITPATVDNGCLCVIPGSHRKGLTTHCPGPDGLTIPDKLLGDQPVPVPMRVGSVLCMHRLTKHSSLANRSDVIRWSFDLRYQPIGQPTGRQEYPAIVVRSREQPETEVRDYKVWAKRWADARDALAASQRDKKHRWPEDAPICA